MVPTFKPSNLSSIVVCALEIGHVYIALPPYKMSKGKGKKEEVAYAWTDSELEELRRTLPWRNPPTLQRVGEMNVISFGKPP